MADKVEDNKPEPKKKKKEFEYKLHSHTDKLSMLLEMMYELEAALFAHNINMLDKNPLHLSKNYDNLLDIS